MGNRKVKPELFTSPLKAELSRPMLPQPIGWTESSTPSLAETPWPPCAIYFSVSPCLHSLCLSCLLYSNLSLLFPLPSTTDTGLYGYRNLRFWKWLFTSPVRARRAPNSSVVPHRSRISYASDMSCHNCPLCSASDLWCSENWAPHSGWGLANALQRGRIASHVPRDILLFIHQNMTCAFS